VKGATTAAQTFAASCICDGSSLSALGAAGELDLFRDPVPTCAADQPNLVKLFYDSDPTDLQLRYFLLPVEDPHNQVDLLVTRATSDDTARTYVGVAALDAATRKTLPDVKESLPARPFGTGAVVDGKLFTKGAPFEGSSADAPMGSLQWTQTGGGTFAYACVMSNRDNKE
jgi:hypothetical protein